MGVAIDTSEYKIKQSGITSPIKLGSYDSSTKTYKYTIPQTTLKDWEIKTEKPVFIFEAADIDGANGWQVFWKITVPSIRTILLFTLITSLIGGLNMFDIPHLFVRNSGPDNATLTTSVLIHRLAFSGGYQYNRASALSMIMFIIIVLASMVVFVSMRDKDTVAQNKLRKQAIKAQKLAAKQASKGVVNE